ncbi:MAG: acetolactate synthase [Planctomycetes bacterium]|nr:acetolactate synthase [Planctomycetota bacterium]
MSHGQGEDSGAAIGFATARGRDWPSVRQFNVFVPNRVGGLLDVVRRFESSDNRIVSLTVVDTADCAIIRLVVRDPERAAETLEHARLPYTESDLLVVQLPDGKQPLLEIFKAMLVTETNIHYAYPLLIGPHGCAAVALHVEDHEAAAANLARQNFTLFTENDLSE